MTNAFRKETYLVRTSRIIQGIHKFPLTEIHEKKLFWRIPMPRIHTESSINIRWLKCEWNYSHKLLIRKKQASKKHQRKPRRYKLTLNTYSVSKYTTEIFITYRQIVAKNSVRRHPTRIRNEPRELPRGERVFNFRPFF